MIYQQRTLLSVKIRYCVFFSSLYINVEMFCIFMQRKTTGSIWHFLMRKNYRKQDLQKRYKRYSPDNCYMMNSCSSAISSRLHDAPVTVIVLLQKYTLHVIILSHLIRFRQISGGSTQYNFGHFPLSVQFLHFHAVFRKIWPNNRLAPPLWLAPPVSHLLEYIYN